jgi:hypothetical protein
MLLEVELSSLVSAPASAGAVEPAAASPADAADRTAT